MDRRTAIKKTGLLFGATLTISTGASILQSCLNKQRNIGWEPKFMSINNALLVNDITNILIPDTNIPDKVKNVIPKYLDEILMNYSLKEEQDNFSNGIESFDIRCEKDMGAIFMDCNSQQKITFLKEEEKQFVASEHPTFYGTLKQLVFESLFQTEHGITQFLDFNPVPGGYSGCVPLSDIDKIQFTYDTFKL